jgi:hypothetical protein
MAALASMSRGMKIFLTVDALLVVAVVLVAIAVLGGGSDQAGEEPGGGSSPSQSAGSGATDGATDAGAQSFASPTGNISCTMSPDGVTCSIANKQFDVPAAEGCTGTTGHVIVLNTSDGMTTPCVEGPAPAVASADVPVLDYGSAKTVGPYTCTSASNGMSCVVDETGEGFRVATAALTTLP